MNPRTRTLLAIATIAGLVLVGELVATERLVRSAADPALAGQVTQNLLVAGASALALVGLAGWIGARRIALALRRLADAMSAMARTGELESDFESTGGGSDVKLIEDTFRRLVVSHSELQHARERSYVEAVGAVVTAVDARDHETTGHSFRVAHYAVALARAMGIEGQQLKGIEWGALVHDVGKMVVPDSILRKVGPLTDDEWHIMRQHPSWGFEMLAEVRFLKKPAIDIVYSHHERWDGSGYPRGLKGRDIPLPARIFAVVDAYDAMTSDRPYRRARGHQAAIAELQRVAGTQLDPEVVEAFLAMPEVELRRLREMCKRVHPGLSIPTELLDSLAEMTFEAERVADERR